MKEQLSLILPVFASHAIYSFIFWKYPAARQHRFLFVAGSSSLSFLFGYFWFPVVMPTSIHTFDFPIFSDVSALITYSVACAFITALFASLYVLGRRQQ